MLRKTLSTFSLLALVTGCASWTSPPKRETSAPPKEKIFSESFEAVWAATQLALQSYPMKIDDAESGVFETQYIRGEKAWVSPGEDNAPAGGQRYLISVKIIKGKNAQGTTATKVTVLKRAENQRDFFSEYEKTPSDGLEELSIIYRIERELQISKALQRVKVK